MGRRKRGHPVNGWIVVDKPSGIGSTTVVSKVRRAYDAQKAGHAGTLDPLATGILPIALGEATKTVPNLVDAAKTYTFTVRWGEARDTDDIDGTVVATCGHRPDRAAIEAALPAFVGEIEQLPPKFSALKIDGERAYDLARRGEVVELAPRLVTVHRIELLDLPDADHARCRVHCGKGTYVRAIARDLGLMLGTYGAVSELRRNAVGPFTEACAIPLAMLETLGNIPPSLAAPLPVETALDDIPALAINELEAARLRSGQSIRVIGRTVTMRLRSQPIAARDAEGPAYAALAADGRWSIVALGSLEAGEFRPHRIFNV